MFPTESAVDPTNAIVLPSGERAGLRKSPRDAPEFEIRDWCCPVSMATDESRGGSRAELPETTERLPPGRKSKNETPRNSEPSETIRCLPSGNQSSPAQNSIGVTRRAGPPSAETT